MLTGKEIAKRAILTNFVEDYIQQQGIDVRVKRVFQNHNDPDNIGIIPKTGKTIIPVYEEYAPHTLPNGMFGWYLFPGYYEVEFEEGCNIPNNCCLQFKTRSSMIRCGGEVRSGLFDAGFHTQNMGAFLKIEQPMLVEFDSRIAQVIVDESSEVENTYNGQWQGDNQRKN